MTTTTDRAHGMSVSALAARVGVRPDTVRYYERAGLLPAPARTSAEHRRYDEGAVDRLQFIQGAQRLGLRLREIRDLLAVADTGTAPASRRRICSSAGAPRSTPRSPDCRPCEPRSRESLRGFPTGPVPTLSPAAGAHRRGGESDDRRLRVRARGVLRLGLLLTTA